MIERRGAGEGGPIKQLLPLPPAKTEKALWEVAYLKFLANILIRVQTLARAHCQKSLKPGIRPRRGPGGSAGEGGSGQRKERRLIRKVRRAPGLPFAPGLAAPEAAHSSCLILPLHSVPEISSLSQGNAAEE